MTPSLTERQSQHARLILDGLTNQEIAMITNRTLGSVKQTNHWLYRKLDIQSRLQLMALAHREGLWIL